MTNTFCHMELHSGDTSASKDFYYELFGWGMQDMPMGEQTYTMFRTCDSDDEVHGGIARTQCPDNTSAWLSYVLTDDVAGSLKKAITERFARIPFMFGVSRIALCSLQCYVQ